MPLVSCPECGANVSTDAAVCPHCGFPRPAAGQAAPAPARRGVSAGWVIVAVLAVGVMMVGVLGWGVYRVVERVNGHGRRPGELVDFTDTLETPPPALATAPPSPAPTSAGGGVAGDDPPADDPNRTFELAEVDEQPVLANRQEVAAALSRNYPPLLRDAGVSGTATIRMRVDRNGLAEPSSITVESSTHELFGDAAVRVAERLRFRPARYRGNPVPVWVTLPITFQIQD